MWQVSQRSGTAENAVHEHLCIIKVISHMRLCQFIYMHDITHPLVSFTSSSDCMGVCAEHCLGYMENSRGARAVRECEEIDELDARIATVAVHLGMMDEATRLYIGSGRYDLLNKLYQACGQWDKALEVAEKHDRIHLKVKSLVSYQNNT